MQPNGQGGARHFENLTWELQIPEFDRRIALHHTLAEAAQSADAIAESVALVDGAYFMTKRRAIREALAASGVSERIDALVTELLDR
jgi:hypothetical protein